MKNTDMILVALHEAVKDAETAINAVNRGERNPHTIAALHTAIRELASGQMALMKIAMGILDTLTEQSE